MSGLDRWNVSNPLEEGEIIEEGNTEQLNSDELPSYQFCVPPDDTHTTDTTTTNGTTSTKRSFTETLIENNGYFDNYTPEPPLKKKRISSTISNPYPTLTLHIPSDSLHSLPIYQHHTHKHHQNNTNHRHKRYRSRSRNRYNSDCDARSRYHHRSISKSLSRSISPIHSYKSSTDSSKSSIDSKSPSLSNGLSNNMDIEYSPDIIDDLTKASDALDQQKLELLKQKAIQSIKMNKNQLNRAGLLKDDILEDTFNTYSLCKSIITDIVDNITKTKQTEFENDKLASLRALALKSLQTSPGKLSKESTKNTDTNSVDMDISPDIASNHSDNDIINDIINDIVNEPEPEPEPDPDPDINAFSLESQKLTLILSQIRQKVNERNGLISMAESTANQLHGFVDKFNLSPDLHRVLNGLITQTVYECPNCQLNEIKHNLEIQQIQQKYHRQIKKLKKIKGKRKKKRKYKKIINNHQIYKKPILLTESINDLDINELYWNNKESIDLFEMYNNTQSKTNDDKETENKALITSKIETNLLLYYQDHSGFVDEKKQKYWENLDFMKEYTLDQLSMLN